MTIQFYPGIGDQCWNKEVILARLNNVAEADKTKQWIQQDLSTPQSSYVGKSFWVVAKHFDFMRRGIYGVDLDVSKNILERLTVVVREHPEMTDLFLKAVNNFQRITGRAVDVPFQIFQRMMDESCPIPCAPLPVCPPKTETVFVEKPVIIEKPVVVTEPVIIREPIVVPDPVFIPRPVPVFVPPPVIRPVVRPRPIFVPPPLRPTCFNPPRVIPGTGCSTAPMCPPSVINVPPRVIPGTGHTTTVCRAPKPVCPPAPPRVIPGTTRPTNVCRPAAPARPAPQPTCPVRTQAAPAANNAHRVAVGYGGTRRR